MTFLSGDLIVNGFAMRSLCYATLVFCVRSCHFRVIVQSVTGKMGGIGPHWS
jgi:hypothetical protein